MELGFFDEVAEAVRGLVPDGLGDLRLRPRRWGLKVWFGERGPTREHYEAQVIAPDGVDGASMLALEIGFHAEHRSAADNDAVIARLVAGQGGRDGWRQVLGEDAVVGTFLGPFPAWRRVSETWPDPDLSEPELPLQAALRLTDYVAALEPLRRGG